MPQYRVKAVGFFGGILRKPGHPRLGVVRTDEPLKPVPSWLEEMKAETAAAKKKRLAAEKKTAAANEEKAEEDKVDIDAVTFTEPAPGTKVTTL